jgi:hypothetical protein
MPALKSITLRAGRSSYYFDLKRLEGGKLFFSIAEVRIDRQNQKRKATLHIIERDIDAFVNAIAEMSSAVEMLPPYVPVEDTEP